jgi:putative PIN family toxin of toxin-antitoxin system
MTLPAVTADANLLASGALQLHPDAAPAQFVNAWRSGRFSLVLSDHLLTEVSNSLAKRYFVQRLGDNERTAFRRLLEREATITPITVTVSGIATHPEDDLVLATALSGGAQFVVTGDHKLVRLKAYQGLILMSVHEFLATLPGLTAADR